MKNKKKRAVPAVILSLSILLAAAAAVFFSFSPTGYRMSVPVRASFEKLSDNVFDNRDYAGNRDVISALTETVNGGGDFGSAFGG